MPELPEVEYATGVLRKAAEGKTLARIVTPHKSFARRLPARRAKWVQGKRVRRVERVGKHQVLHLDDDLVIVAHFRLDGDWKVDTTHAPLEKFARAAMEFTDGTRVSLLDFRALATLAIHRAGEQYLPSLGPDPTDPQLNVEALCAAIGRRSLSIKQILLDQKILAGVGNIYAAEALWLAKIDPRVTGKAIGAPRCRKLIAAVQQVLADGDRASARYRTAGDARLNVYDREGQPCPRCGRAIQRIPQGTRSTYFCASCQKKRA
jgi:formamidopyrimidine-DNA glycosylase